MDEDPTIGFLQADVARFCGSLETLAPDARMHLVVRLRTALDAVTGPALVSAMAAAKNDGWGLRRIGDVVGLSHEKVRYRLAAAPAPAESAGRP